MIIAEGLQHFLFGIHDERAATRDRLIQAPAGYQQEACAFIVGGYLNVVAIAEYTQSPRRDLRPRFTDAYAAIDGIDRGMVGGRDPLVEGAAARQLDVEVQGIGSRSACGADPSGSRNPRSFVRRARRGR